VETPPTHQVALYDPVMRISLRQFMRDDCARLVTWVNAGGAESFVRWAGSAFKYPLTEQALEAHLAEADGPAATRRLYAAVDEGSGEVVGHVELSRLDPANGSAMVSRLLVGDPLARGKGIGTQIVSRLLELGFSEMGLRRLTVYILDFNLPAIRMYEGLGFKTEGFSVEAWRVGERYWNVYYMAILREWWLSRASV
jgi:RimJ/RimL family protein N-acetyltransferase